MSRVPESRLSACAPVLEGSQVSAVAPSLLGSELGSKVSAVAPSLLGSALGSKAPSKAASQVSLAAPASSYLSSSLPALPALPAVQQVPDDQPWRHTVAKPEPTKISTALDRFNSNWTTTYAGMSLKIPGRPPPPPVPPPPTEAEEKERRRRSRKPRVYLDSEQRMAYVDHGPAPPGQPIPVEKPYVKTKAQKAKEESDKRKYWEDIKEARRQEQARKDRTKSDVEPGALTAPLKPPMSEVHYNFIGGPASALWKSDYRGNMVEFGEALNARYAQPTKLAIVSSPISGWPGVVGDPRC